MCYKFHFSVLTLLGPRTASLSASCTHIIQVLGVQGNCQHAPSPIPDQLSPGYPLKASSCEECVFHSGLMTVINLAEGDSPSLSHFTPPQRRKFKELTTMKTTSATFIFSSLPSALITIFLDIE